MERVKIFKGFERFWHWTQAALIIVMLITGFNIHGSYHLFTFEQAVDLHITLAWTLIGLWAFAIFWHFTTGEWRQYLPTQDKLLAVAKFYAVGIFRGEVHPYRKTQWAKHNPLQRLAYLFFKVIISPVIWVSGLLYLYYTFWPEWGLADVPLGVIALTHTAAAFAMLFFFIVHVYLALLGKKTVFTLSHVKSMITGYDEVYEEAE